MKTFKINVVSSPSILKFYRSILYFVSPYIKHSPDSQGTKTSGENAPTPLYLPNLRTWNYAVNWIQICHIANTRQPFDTTIKETVVKWLGAKSGFCLYSTGISGFAIRYGTSRLDCTRQCCLPRLCGTLAMAQAASRGTGKTWPHKLSRSMDMVRRTVEALECFHILIHLDNS